MQCWLLGPTQLQSIRRDSFGLRRQVAGAAVSLRGWPGVVSPCPSSVDSVYRMSGKQQAPQQRGTASGGARATLCDTQSGPDMQK